MAISVPIFSQQLHKARVATDWANVRNYYSQLQYDFMETETVKDEYLNVWGKPGITSFSINRTDCETEKPDVYGLHQKTIMVDTTCCILAMTIMTSVD